MNEDNKKKCNIKVKGLLLYQKDNRKCSKRISQKNLKLNKFKNKRMKYD